MTNSRQTVRVQLNSGIYTATVIGKVAAKHKGEFFRMYEVELLNHPTLKKINVRREAIIGVIPNKEAGNE